jgi:hypothetical protein
VRIEPGWHLLKLRVHGLPNVRKVRVKVTSRRLPLWLHGMNRRRRRWHSISILINISITHVTNICIFIITSMNLNIFSNILSLCSLPIRCHWLVEKSFSIVKWTIKFMLHIT